MARYKRSHWKPIPLVILHHGLCDRTGKNKYATRKDARRAVKSSVNRYGEHRSIWGVYVCHHCHQYHIGHK